MASSSLDHVVLIWDIFGLTPGADEQGHRLDLDKADELWSALASRPAWMAYSALGKLVLAPEVAVPLLRERLKPVPTVSKVRLKGWVADLDSVEFHVRQRASMSLEEAGDQAVPLLRLIMAGRPSTELKHRVDELLEIYRRQQRSPESLRERRALTVLEQIGTPAAREVLATLATGPADASLTSEARAALDRLAKLDANNRVDAGKSQK